MQQNSFQELVFSDKPGKRLLRHFLFWFFWWFYFAMLHAANPFGKPEVSYFRNLPFTLSESILLLIPQLPLTYAVLYGVFPLVVKRRFVLAVPLFVLTYWLVASFNLYMILHVNTKVLQYILPPEYMRGTQRPENVSYFMAMIGMFKGGLMTSAMALGVKAMKNWRLREERNLQLMREKADAQLQLLTAQIHPHFLFNTLNNIYSQTQLGSPKGSEMIMELSDLLRYILYEGRKSQVPLVSELQMVVDYINLERIRYGNSLQLSLDLPEKTNDLYIAPLLLLPFIENCFKHGASKHLHAPWINLAIAVEGDIMNMELGNGKAEGTSANNEGGIGIQNVYNRLRLLYPDSHQLEIDETNDVFRVRLQLKLQRGADVNRKGNHLITKESMAYAG